MPVYKARCCTAHGWKPFRQPETKFNAANHPQLSPAHGLQASRRGRGQPFQTAQHPRPRSEPETFAKPVTDGAPVARRHFGKSVMLCLISNLATSRRRSILGFRLLLGVLQRFQSAYGNSEYRFLIPSILCIVFHIPPL